MNIETLKKNLIEDLKPVSPLANTNKQLYRYLILCCSIIIFFSYSVGVREDLTSASDNILYYLELAVLFVLPFSIAYNALVLAIPGRSSVISNFLSLIMLLSWTFIIFSNLGNNTNSNLIEPHYDCMIIVMIATVLFSLVLASMISKSYPTKYTYTYLLTLLSSSSLGALTLHIVCPITSFIHLFYMHYLPVLLVPVIALPIVLYLIRKIY